MIKLTEQKLKSCIEEGLSKMQIAKHFNISSTTIRNYAKKWLNEEAWKKLLQNGRNSQGRHKPVFNKELFYECVFIKKCSSVEIARQFNLSSPTIKKYAGLLFGEPALLQLQKSGWINKSKFNYKDGRGIYRKFKKDQCEKCGVKGKLEAHHIKPAEYDSNWNILIRGDHSKENILTLCNSCHQKLHYRELYRRGTVKKDNKTGRFLHA